MWSVTPRERAEALGWVRTESHSSARSAAWVAPIVNRFGPDYRPPVAMRTIGDEWATVLQGVCILPTEDEALAHALLLRDVVLS